MVIHISIDEIRAQVPEASVTGDASPDITSVASIEEAGANDATFLTGADRNGLLENCHAGVVFVPLGTTQPPAVGQVFFAVKDPSLGLAKMCEIFEHRMRPAPAAGIAPTAFVHPTAKVAATASVGPNCTVGEGSVIGEGAILEAGVHLGTHVVVGDNSYFHHGVVVEDYCRVGKRVRLQTGAKIGGDGFGYIQVGKLPDVRHYKVPQIGNVVIGDDVEVGANATIDRARFGSTVIGEGTKIDNLVQIAHNVKIGRRCIICSQVGIAGSTTLGDYVVMWGQAGTVGHISIGNFAFIGAQAGVAKSIPDQAKVTGTPARPLLEMRKSEAALMRLPDMMSKLRKLLADKPDCVAEKGE